jgi:uncharacterized membrane protein (UPF0182 family)
MAGLEREGRSTSVHPVLRPGRQLGMGFYLDHYELLYSTQGVVYGAGYTADHVTRIAFWIMAGAAAALCALLVLNIFRPRFRAIAIGSGIYVGLYFIAVWLAPALFQRFMVQPNELARETPYLKNNIEFTRKAYSSTRSRKHPTRR